jgi:hypothetical protein
MGITRAIEHETILEQFKLNNGVLSNLVKPGHTIGEPAPIIKRIEDADVNTWKEKFAGSGKGGQEKK